MTHPTAENVNALPEWARDYIHRLEANTDPQGEIRRAMIAEMQLAAVNKMLEEAPIVKVRGKVGELAIIVVSHSFVGKRVRLVVVDE